MAKTLVCWSCGTVTGINGPVGRGETCNTCRSDLRCCKNCAHYDPKSYNECREPAAERVVDKKRGNFCDFFTPFDGQRVADAKADDARAKLEGLFKK